MQKVLPSDMAAGSATAFEDASPCSGEQTKNLQADLVCYEHNAELFRLYNHLFWQLPMSSVAITALLWGLSAVAGAERLHLSSLILSAVLDVGVILVLYRVRHVISAVVGKLQHFNANAYAHAPSTNLFNGGWMLMISYTLALGSAAICSIWMAFG